MSDASNLKMVTYYKKKLNLNIKNYDAYEKQLHSLESRGLSPSSTFLKRGANYKEQISLALSHFPCINLLEKNIVDSPRDQHIVHCISGCLAMSRGAAVDICKEYPENREILSGRVGSVSICNATHRSGSHSKYIFNLITKSSIRKNVPGNRSTYRSLQSSLNELKDLIIKFDIKKLALTKLCCGLDGLRWETVEEMLTTTFKDMTLDLVVYSNGM